MNKKLYTYLTLPFLCSLFFTTVFSQSGQQAAIDSLYRRASQLGIFNGNVLVVEQGRVLYKASLGYANAAKTIPLTEAYKFHIGSIAKEFNATAIMMMAEQGKLKLSDPVSKFITGLPQWSQKITVKQLLQYTSGLPDGKWKMVKTDDDNMRDLKEIVALDFEPGTNYAYNNNNTFLQRRIVEKCAGVSFNSFVKDSMLTRLGMTASMPDPTAADQPMALSFDNEGRQDSLKTPISGWTAVTINDFYTWSESVNHFRLINPASTEQILVPVSKGRQSGLGGGEMANGKILSHIHNGTSLNYEALMVYSGATDRTVIMITSNKNFKLYELNDAVQAILDGKPYEIPKKSVFRELLVRIDTLDGKGLLRYYKQLRSKYPDDYSFDKESELNIAAYQLLNKKRYDDAILLFAHNATLFPKSANVFDSLGEAYYKKGDKAMALLNYRKSLDIDPTNTTAQKMVEELESRR